MPQDDRVIEEALRSIRQREWLRLKPLLHPYLHWTSKDARQIRGRTNVLDYLAANPVRKRPTGHELRDGQIYRWIEA